MAGKADKPTGAGEERGAQPTGKRHSTVDGVRATLFKVTLLRGK